MKKVEGWNQHNKNLKKLNIKHAQTLDDEDTQFLTAMDNYSTQETEYYRTKNSECNSSDGAL